MRFPYLLALQVLTTTFAFPADVTTNIVERCGHRPCIGSLDLSDLESDKGWEKGTELRLELAQQETDFAIYSIDLFDLKLHLEGQVLLGYWDLPDREGIKLNY